MLETLCLQGGDALSLMKQVDQIDNTILKMERGLRVGRSEGYLSLPMTKAA